MKAIKLLTIIFLLLVPLFLNALEGDRREGTWMQFVWNKGRWDPLGTFVVYKENEVYKMLPLKQVTRADVVNTVSLYDLKYKDDKWLFMADWGEGRVGIFKLLKDGPGLYRGYSYLGVQRLDMNMWLLVK